jgi:hypothetical protein
MCAKSQELDILQEMNDAESRFRKIVKQSGYWDRLNKFGVMENYKNGKLAIILNCVFHLDENFVRPVFHDGPSIPSEIFAMLILQAQTFDMGNVESWEQEPVLVRDIQIVDATQQMIPIISSVRLYVGDNPFEECGTKGVYFSPLKRTFYFCPRITHGEFGFVVENKWNVFFDGSQVRVFNGSTDVMDGITDDESHVIRSIANVGARVRQHLQGKLRVTLDGRNVGLWQSGNERLQFQDMLIGPIDFESGGCEAVNHGG